MRSLFYDIHRTVARTVERSGYSISRILLMLGISRSWYYSQMSSHRSLTEDSIRLLSGMMMNGLS